MSARDALHARLYKGQTENRDDLLDAYRAEVLREAGGVADELIATVDRNDPDAFARVDSFRVYSDRLHEIADGGTPARKDTGDASKAPAGESTQPTADTDASTAFMQLGTTQSLAGLRAELHIEGRPPIVGRYAGFGSRAVDPHILLIQPALIFKWLDEATPEGEAARD